MLDYLLKSLPFLFLAYFSFSLYTEYEEHLEKLVEKKAQITPLDTQINKISKDLQEIDEVKRNIVEYESKIDQYNQEIEVIKEKIPPLEDKTKILAEFKTIADNLNIRQTVFRPRYVRENEGGVYFSNGIEFEASGTYLQFLILFERLAQSTRLLNVAEVRLRDLSNGSGRTLTPGLAKASSRHNLITISAIIESFHYNDVRKKDSNGGSN